jgi:GxxExxY protein
MNTMYPFQDQTYRVIGACFEVYNAMGCGFLEPVYQECLQIEMVLQAIPHDAQAPVVLDYKGHTLTRKFTLDFLCFGNLIVEIKAVERLADEHRAQVINYLHASGLELALLVNFGHYPGLEFERLIRSSRHPKNRAPGGAE